MITFASGKSNLRGRINDDKISFIESNLVSCIDSPTKKIFSPSKYALCKYFDMPKSTGYRKFNLAQTKRKILFEQDDDSVEYLWSSVKKRKPYSKISLELRSKVIEWLKKHPHIIQSPNFNDTLIVKDKSNNGLCIREQKYLHQISIRELHNDLLSKHPIGLSEVYDKEGNPLISDTAF